MGACNSASNKRQKKKNYNYQINCHYEMSGNKSLDDIFKEPYESLNDIDASRQKFAFHWNSLLSSSGAIVVKHPTIKSCLYGYLCKLSYELNKPTMEKLRLENNSPWFILERDMLTVGSKKALNEVDKSLTFFTDIKDSSEELYTQFKAKYETAKTQIDDFKVDTLPLEEKAKISEHISKHMDNLEHAMETISYIKNITFKKDSDITSVQEDLARREFLDELLQIGTETSQEQYDPVKTMWKYSKEMRLNTKGDVEFREREIKVNSHVV